VVGPGRQNMANKTTAEQWNEQEQKWEEEWGHYHLAAPLLWHAAQ